MAKSPPSSYEFFRAMQEEIQAYKWSESQKAGEDIGWERALTEWVEKHGSTWRKKHLEAATAEAQENSSQS